MHTDICIVGGGLVGLTAALAFATRGHRVSLLESTDLLAEEPAALDARSLALSLASVRILQALGLWRELESLTAGIRHIHVSSAGRLGVTRLDAGDMQLDAMGYVIEYHLLIKHLLQRVARNDLIEMVSPATFRSMDQQQDAVTLRYRVQDSDESLRTSLLVVADGANSSVREFLGIGSRVRDFSQQAIIANVQLERPARGIAYERFTTDGPMAMLPLPADRYALVWTNDRARSEALMACSSEDFLEELYAGFGYRLGYFAAVGERSAFPLRLTRASQLVSERCVLIGNAANTLHPVAGQGLNLAMRDIAALFDLLDVAELSSSQLVNALADYANNRRADHQRTVGLSTLLVDLFSNDLPLLDHARAGALMALDVCPILKREFSWQGMGFGSAASSLMRGRHE